MEFKLTVFGKPATAGSKKGFPIRNKAGDFLGVRVADDNPKSKPWQAQIRAEAAAAMDRRVMLSGPLGVSMTFIVQRPKGHFGARGDVKASAPAYPATRPDVLKYARCAEDALTGIVWRDDAQIVVELLKKEFGEPERAEITVRPIDAATVQAATTEFEQLGLLRVG